MRISCQLFQNCFEIPSDWLSIPTYQLFEKIGLVKFLYAGFPTFLPIGQRLVNNVNNIIREEATRMGFEEIYLPLVQDICFLEKSGRANQFRKEFFEIRNSKFILTPTNEEVYIVLISQGIISPRQFPIRLFQIADKFRNVRRPRGIFRSKQFLMCDMISIDRDEKMLKESITIFEEIAKAVFRRLEISVVRVEHHKGRYVEFLVPCKEGENYIPQNTECYGEKDLRASSVAMYFLFHLEEVNFLKKPNNLLKSCVGGSYGFGIQRCIHAVIEQHRDQLGIAFPKSIRPFDIAIILLEPNDMEQRKLAEEWYHKLIELKVKAWFDDRNKKTLKEKTRLAEFYGIPLKLIIGRQEAATRTFTLKWRSGKEEKISPDINTIMKILQEI